MPEAFEAMQADYAAYAKSHGVLSMPEGYSPVRQVIINSFVNYWIPTYRTPVLAALAGLAALAAVGFRVRRRRRWSFERSRSRCSSTKARAAGPSAASPGLAVRSVSVRGKLPLTTRRFHRPATGSPRSCSGASAIPDDPERENNERAREGFKHWDKPSLTLFSIRDPVTRGGASIWQMLVPGAQGQPHAVIRGAGHLLQGDKGAKVAAAIVAFVGAASGPDAR